jgi:hypothetical protein
MTSPNTIIADLVDDRNRMSAALHRIVFEAASYSDCVAIAKDFIGAGILPYSGSVLFEHEAERNTVALTLVAAVKPGVRSVWGTA